MKTTFSFNRLLKLFRNDWALNYKKYGLQAVCVICITALFYIFCALINVEIYLPAVFILGMVALGFFQGIYTATVWGEFPSKKKTISLLTLPVNQSEMFIPRFISCFIIFPILFVLYILLLMKLTTWYNLVANLNLDLTNIHFTSVAGTLEDIFFPYACIYIFLWLFIASAFFWGALHFKKYAFLKTLAFWIVGLFLLWPVSIILRLIITGEYNYAIIPFIAYIDGYEGIRKYLYMFSVWPNIYYYLSGFMSLALLCISYIKLKEKTI